MAVHLTEGMTKNKIINVEHCIPHPPLDQFPLIDGLCVITCKLVNHLGVIVGHLGGVHYWRGDRGYTAFIQPGLFSLLSHHTFTFPSTSFALTILYTVD